MKLLAADDEKQIDGRTRLQKLVFLAQKETSKSLPSEYTFIPYDYGPFSADLLHDVDDLKQAGYIIENQEYGPQGKKYIYELTEEGEDAVQESLNDLAKNSAKAIEETSEFIEGMFNNTPITRLLEYVYNNYPKFAEESVLK